MSETDYAIKQYSKMIGVSRSEQKYIIETLRLRLKDTWFWQIKKRRDLRLRLAAAEFIQKFPEKIKEAQATLEQDLNEGLFG
jgi:hypothetical protein